MIFLLLINLTNKAASTVIYEAFFALNISEEDYVQLTFLNYAPFCNKKTQKKLLAFATKVDGSAMNAVKCKAAWDTLIKKPADMNPLFMEEILF